LSKLGQAHRERAALEGVKSDYGDQLDDEQRADLKKRLDNAQRATAEALGPAYVVALRVHEQDVESCTLSDAEPSFAAHLGLLWNALVEDEEWILRRLGSVTLEKTGLVPKEEALRLRDAIDAFLRFTDKPMIAGKNAVTDGLEQACEDALVGIGRGASPAALQARYCKQPVSLDPTEEGVWIIPAFEAEPAEAAETVGRTGIGGEEEKETGGEQETGRKETTDVVSARTVKRFSVKGSVPMESWGELFRCFVSPAARMDLKKLQLGIQFEMEVPDSAKLDLDDPSLKAMKESARQLGLQMEIDRE
jgi:hypothetical protein